MIILAAMLVPGRFLSGMQSPAAPTWVAGSVRGRLSKEPKDDEHGNSERLGTECKTILTKRPIAGRS